jgi:hypothetical protein
VLLERLRCKGHLSLGNLVRPLSKKKINEVKTTVKQ